MNVLRLAHVLVLGPLLIALGLGYSLGVPRAAIAVVGAFILLYHAYKIWAKLAAGKNPWVNVIHVLVVGPALLAHGLLEPPARWTREVLLMLGIAAVGYHGYYLIPHAS
jgi:hypothetical protein